MGQIDEEARKKELNYEKAGYNPFDMLVPLLQMLQHRYQYGKLLQDKLGLSEDGLESVKYNIDYINEKIKQILGL